MDTRQDKKSPRSGRGWMILAASLVSLVFIAVLAVMPGQASAPTQAEAVSAGGEIAASTAITPTVWVKPPKGPLIATTSFCKSVLADQRSLANFITRTNRSYRFVICDDAYINRYRNWLKYWDRYWDYYYWDGYWWSR